MIKKLLFFLSISLIFSCKGDDLPKDVLPPEKMESVMWDLIRADQALSLPFNTDTTVNRTLKSQGIYKQILLMHQVSEKDFKRSFRFYQNNPLHLKPVLDSLRTKPADTTLTNKKPVQ